jgi:hypothetical protein
MPYYTLPKLAADKGLSEKFLRGWVAKGYLVADAKSAGGQARYSERAFEQARTLSMTGKPVSAARKRRQRCKALPLAPKPNGLRDYALNLAKQIRNGRRAGTVKKIGGRAA